MAGGAALGAMAALGARVGGAVAVGPCVGRVAALGAVLTLCAAVSAAPAWATAPYSPKQPPLTTPWTNSVSTTDPLPEYPRPQLERSAWMSLNGRWQYEASQEGQPPPVGQNLAETILVPFPVQSALSGIEREDSSGWYRRLFRIPASWRSKHVILNFGAVSWEASVYVNGKLAGTHYGDYDAFSLDITRFLHPDGSNELIVSFIDPVGAVGEAVGKQVSGTPHGFFHTASSGIWQTVWLEPVSAQHITGLDLVPRLDRRELLVTATLARPGGARGTELRVTALDGRRAVTTVTGAATGTLTLHIAAPVLWTPWHPFLYGLRVQLMSKGDVLDELSSYFGMRSITLGRVGGAVRILLNGRFVFQTGALDQGYWPDGLYTPPSDTAMRFDILAAKRLGYDMVREHQKVQPDRWYYWADRLGILVWQDMPAISILNPMPLTPTMRSEFVRELGRVVVQHRSHPSIVMWVPFNEGWRQFDPGTVTALVRRIDPASLVDADSGSANCCGAIEVGDSDVRDSHLYTGPFAVAPDHRASVIGEYGGILPYPPAGHRWPGQLTSVGGPVLAWPAAPVIKILRQQYAELAQEMRVRGLSAAVFTELTSAEQELGIVTDDRRVFTIPPAILSTLNRSLVDGSRHANALQPQSAAVPTAGSGTWSFSERHGHLARDSSGHHDPLTLEGGAGWTAGPRLSGSASGALSITSPGQEAVTARPVIATGRSFTISVWVKSRKTGQSGTAVSEPGPEGSSFSLGIQTRPTMLGSYASWWTFAAPARSSCPASRCGVRANTRYGDGRYQAQVGRWYQLTAVYDHATQSITLYLDGVPQDVEHLFAVPPANGPLTVGVGSEDYSPSDSFIGAVAMLRTFSRALSPAAVWELYESESAAPATPSGHH